MSRKSSPVLRVLGLLLLVAAPLAGCGSSAQHTPQPAGRLVSVPGSPAGKIVLTAEGAQRLGLQTATVRSAAPLQGAPTAIIPFGSIVYDPSGRTFAFIRQAPLTFREIQITVDHISGNSAYLRKGPRPGLNVVTVGAEELFGVQTGVLEQT